MPGSRLQIDVRHSGNTIVLGLQGELDLSSAPGFADELEQAHRAEPSAIVVDLTNLAFMDSTGLRSILTAQDRCEENGRTFAVVPGSEQVRRLMSITRVSEYLRFVTDPEEATKT